MWIILAAMASIMSGFYDISKKKSLIGNEVLPVLFFSTLSGALVFLPLTLLSGFAPEMAHNHWWYSPSVSPKVHLLIFIKSCIVVVSWLLEYYAIKQLPLTLISTIRSSSPLWTMAGAVLIYSEALNGWQWGGFIATFIFYFLYSQTSKAEGLHFLKNKWVAFMVLSTVVGAISALYDKYLVHNYPRMTMQAFFFFYMVLLMLPILFHWYKTSENTKSFEWRNSIPAIGILLAIADYVYFLGISYPGALICIIIVVRKSSVVVPFAFGAMTNKEQNIRKKSLLLLGIIAGLAILILGSLF